MQIIKVPGVNGSDKSIRMRNAGNAVISELGNSSLLDLEEIHVDNRNLGEQEQLIFDNAKNALENKEKVIFLGGDHSISYSVGRAFQQVFPDCFLIVFDAHADCMPAGKNPTNKQWLRSLVESGWKSGDIILLGLRKIENEERQFLEKNKIRSYEMRNIDNKEDICDLIMEASQGKNLYLSIDIDVVDPAFAPGTLELEPGGFSSSEILYFARRLARMKNLKAVDIVEVFEDDRLTVKLASRILQEFL